MKVLHLVSGELTGGGATRGAYWLHHALREIGVDSRLLTNGKQLPPDPSIIPVALSFAQRIRRSVNSRLASAPLRLYPNRRRWIFSTGFDGLDITRHPAYRDADIIHLHWFNGLVSIRHLRKVEKPIVWTMRDMWPFTGGCHYSIAEPDCTRYEIGCGKCPQLGSRWRIDLSRLIVASKRASLPRQIHFVGISTWLSECARQSSALSNFPIDTITNSIDTREFFPVDQQVARQAIGIPPSAKVILAGAQNIGDFYKGFDLFVAAIQRLQISDVHILMFGRATPELHRQLGTPARLTDLGYLSDTISMRLAYSAADVFVAPSRMDAFGKTLAESMACGTPVVCFDATGPRDIVAHQSTGYRARPFDPEDLAQGITWLLSQGDSRRAQIRTAARTRAVELFDSLVAARSYERLYRQLLGATQ